MQFIMGNYLGAGMIGVIFSGMGNMLLAYVLFFAMVIFAVIGLLTCLKLLLFGRKKKN